MKFLLDVSPAKLKVKRSLFTNLIGGQLLTPLTYYADWEGEYAIDNGAFSSFDKKAFSRLLKRQVKRKERCLFVTIPDVVGNGRRTLELWKYRNRFAPHWPHALVAQNGCEDLEIPWSEMEALFIGGRDPWKTSLAVTDLIKTAKTLNIHVHVGRVNTPQRYDHFTEQGADTCDGSGVCKYDHMLEDIKFQLQHVPPTLFDEAKNNDTHNNPSFA
tara:strand:- start:742 stop:1386 length:645 start_codon:yes stop_codon:yes gene_type:complete